MNKKIIYTFAAPLLIAGFFNSSPAQAKIGCPYGGAINWQGMCDTTTEDGDQYFGPPIEVPDDPPPPPNPPADLVPETNQPGVENNSSNSIEANTPINTISNPNTVVNQNIDGSNNSVSSTVNNINTTSSTVINTNTSTINNVSNISNIFEVSGGYLVVGNNGSTQFVSVPLNNSGTEDLSSEDIVEYLEKEELPKRIVRAINRIPELVQVGDSTRLPRAIRNSESITEDICAVSKNKVRFISSGLCVLEIPVENNVYEHEINIS